MFAKTLIAVVALVGLACNAIQITSPNNSTGWAASGAVQIVWTSVSTDPSNFTLQLITPADPNTPVNIATVQTSDGSYTYTPSSDLTPGSQYRVNAISTTNQAGILAQSPYFQVTAGTSSVSATSSGSSSSSSSASSTGTSAGATAIIPNASGSTTATQTSSSTSAAATTSKSAAGAQTPLNLSAGLLIVLAGWFGILA